ncbi:MAG: hypothetical protein MJE66_01770 [Proteobacteria bacterium]|nr:hypothetical protein [Pseudomonadota bacterium]
MKNRAPPDINNIKASDLRCDESLAALYVVAVQRKFWSDSPEDVLDFWSLAEKALHDDRHGTPGRLFYSLIKAKDMSRVTDAMEQRAQRRLNSADRVALAGRAGCSPLDDEDVQLEIFGREIGYFHSVLMQCFLPQKPLPADQREWQVNHGKASLLVEAGRSIDPRAPNVFTHCAVPAGAKPRIILPHIIGQAVVHKSREVDMGASLTKFLKQVGYEVNGRNGRSVTQAVQDVAQANFYLGGWNEDGAVVRHGQVAEELSFWLERNPDQETFWRPSLLLSKPFYESIQHHRVPVDMEHMRKLRRSPRRMDLYCWLSYRTPQIRKRATVRVPLDALQPIFAPDLRDPYMFRTRLRGDLRAIGRIYAGFDVKLDGQLLRLRHSAPPVARKLVSS